MPAALSKRFFHVLWRFNAIVIAAVALMALAYGALAGFYIVRDVMRTRNVASIAIAPVNTQPFSGTNERPTSRPALEIRQFTKVEGHDVLRAAMTSREPMSDRYYSKEATNTRDVLFYDMAKGTYHRLLGRDDRLIVQMQDLTRPIDEAAASERASSTFLRGRAAAFLALLVDTDSNGDGRLSARDLKSVVLAGPDGRRLTTIARDVDELNGHTLGADGVITLMITDKSGTTLAIRIAGEGFAIERQDAYRGDIAPRG